MARRNRQRKGRVSANRPVTPRVVGAPVARAGTPGRVSRYPPVPFTGTERLLSLTPQESDGNAFIRSFEWNPGLASTFSTGHFQAQNFDKYEMGLRNSISYTPACSTLTSGSTYILIDYDPNDPAPATEEEFADNELTKTCALYGQMTALIEPSQLDHCKMLIRTGPSATDKLLTDPCAIHIGAFGYGLDAVTNGLTLGHFHINYSAKLLVRQPLSSTVAFPRNYAAYEPSGGLVESGTTTINQASTAVNSIGAVNNSVGDITLPPGYYSVHSRLGLIVPITLGDLPQSTFVSVEIHRNGVRVDRSQAVNNHRFETVEAITLGTTTPLLVQEGDTISQVLVHDSVGSINVIEDRSILTFELL